MFRPLSKKIYRIFYSNNMVGVTNKIFFKFFRTLNNKFNKLKLLSVK
jgi:hypothetical protein